LAEAANLGGGLAHALAAARPFGIRYPCQARGNTTAHSSMPLCYKIGMIAGEIVPGRDTEQISWRLTSSPGTSQVQVSLGVGYTGYVLRQRLLHSSLPSSHMSGLANVMTLGHA